MARIVPKLNLNKTPQSVDNNSLIFAKNIKLLKDNTIGRDSGIEDIIFPTELNDYSLVGQIPYNTKIYLFFHNAREDKSCIYEYNEQNNEFTKCKTGWHYSGGIIEGLVTVNLRTDTLLTINEYFENYDDSKPLIPIKTINLSESSDSDNESIYSNAPVIPILNFISVGTYNNIIPNGTYQFFVRYEIHKNHYTSWFPCSSELFTANIYHSDTAQGTVRYMDPTLNTNQSFVFSIEKLDNAFDNVYKSFQVGYIIAHDDVVKAKSWKHFPMTTTHIYFDYDAEYTKDIDIQELLRPVLNLYNVKNLTSFKNKLYVSNYIESDYNKKDIVDLVKNWKVDYYIKNMKNIGTYLYKSLPANDTKVTYEDANEETKEEDIITSFGSYNNISAILNNRNELLDNSIGYIEETNTHATEEENETYIFKPGSIEPMFVAYEDVVGTFSGNGDDYRNRLSMEWWFNKAYKNENQISNSSNLCYSLNTIAILRTETDNPTKIEDTDVINRYGFNEDLWHEDKLNVWKDQTLGRNHVRNTIASSIVGFLAEGDDKGKPVFSFNDEDGTEHSYSVYKFREFFTNFRLCNSSDVGSSQGVVYVDPEVGYKTKSGKTYLPPDKVKHYYVFNVRQQMLYRDYYYHLVANDITKGSDFERTNVKTLIPFQSYNFYIHFVKNTGEITNGYLIDEYTQEYIKDCQDHVQLIPKFIYDNKNDKYSSYKETLKNFGYKYYFFSIAKTSKTVAELINKYSVETDDSTEDNPKHRTIFDCIDIDTLQLPLVSSIPIYGLRDDDNNKSNINNLLNYTGTYIDSGQLEKNFTRLFGASGKVLLQDTDVDYAAGVEQWFVILDTKANTDILELIKCTKYFKIDDGIADTIIEISDDDANLQDYICTVSKKVDNELDKFISSTDYFDKKVLQLGYDINSATTVGLNDIVEYMPIVNTKHTLIYSTFNLNFLSLTNNINRLIRKFEYKDPDTEEVRSSRQMISAFNSLTLSDLYTFPAMYKDYIRRYYSTYSVDNTTNYNNTIRSSALEGDENKTYVYMFLAEDTYNIPTDKGRIVNLISSGDAVLVHTQDSIFKFTGKVALTSADTMVQTTESNIFDTGIQEVVGSKYGFAGLRNKYHSLLCQFGYIFWDADVNVIYAYTGEGQMSPISDPINKILNFKKVTDIKFCEDYYNDRFFIHVTYEDKNSLLLSYNIKAKSFISLHDFTFDKTFNTKTNTYFVRKLNTKNFLYKLSNTNIDYSGLYVANSVYPSIAYVDLSNPDKDIPAAIIDIIFNDSYESIKTLDSISWICSEIDETHIVPPGDTHLFLAEEKLDRTYPGNTLRIYTDSCASEIINILKASNYYDLYKQKIGNTDKYKEVDALDKNELHTPTSVISESYKLPRYNLGKWSFNYFRDILNINGPHSTGISDNSSLIYGKYFVFRFVFSNNINFKFENFSVNISNNYGNN